MTKTRLYSFDPLKAHCYIVKLEFTGAYIIFLISAQKHRLWVLVRTADCGNSLEPPRLFLRDPTIYVLSRNMKNIRLFLPENFHFWVVNFSVYLNRHVFVMASLTNMYQVRVQKLNFIFVAELKTGLLALFHLFVYVCVTPYCKNCIFCLFPRIFKLENFI